MTAPVFLRVIEREARIYRRLWRGSIFTYVVGPALFLAAIGIGLGGLVDANAGSVGGLSYLAFVTPGLLAASAMQGSAGDALWPVMGGFRWMRTFHAMAATPISAFDVYIGNVVWICLKTALAATAFVLVATVFGGIESVGAVLAIPAAALCAAAFAAPLSAYAATRHTDASFALILRLAIQPLFVFSGTFFPISQLPEWLQRLAVLSPLFHGVELCRMATTGIWDLGAAAIDVGVLGACVAGGVWWGRRTFTARLAT
jgi:lipooligosaccharide transport system permease protein